MFWASSALRVRSGQQHPCPSALYVATRTTGRVARAHTRKPFTSNSGNAYVVCALGICEFRLFGARRSAVCVHTATRHVPVAVRSCMLAQRLSCRIRIVQTVTPLRAGTRGFVGGEGVGRWTASRAKQQPRQSWDWQQHEDRALARAEPPAMGEKRKADEGGGPTSKSAKKQLVNPNRMRELKGGDVGDGPVLYWCVRRGLLVHARRCVATNMQSRTLCRAAQGCAPNNCSVVSVTAALICVSFLAWIARYSTNPSALSTNTCPIHRMSRDQRIRDNWALLYAAEQAQTKGSHLAVCFNLLDTFLSAGARQFGFMLRGLRELAPRLEAANVRFHLLRGEPKDTVPRLVEELGAALLVADQSPLRLKKEWSRDVAAALDVPFHEVDAHNIVPVRATASFATAETCPACNAAACTFAPGQRHGAYHRRQFGNGSAMGGALCAGVGGIG